MNGVLFTHSSFSTPSASSKMPASSSFTSTNLNDDVLLCIFTMNADMFSDSLALNTTRIASQVCRQWRGLLLDTPSLWAKLIDINIIRFAPSQEWGNELIRRTGAAPLWIRAHSCSVIDHLRTEPAHRYKLFKPFFVSFISGNWHRIQKLVINGAYTSFGLKRSMLCSAAPQMEEFDVYLRDSNKKAKMSPIFAGDAPVLRRFSFVDSIVDLAPSWLGRLIFMEINSAYSVRDALAVLSDTHNLQELKIDDVEIGDLSTPLPIVSLPHLKDLQSWGHPHPCAALLDHLHIPSMCSSTMWIPPYNQDRPIQLVSMINTFIRYTERYLHCGTFNIIRLDYTPEKYITLECETTRPFECQFRLLFPLHNDHDSNLLVTFVDQIAHLDLSSFTRFRLRTAGPLNSSLVPLLRSLSSLEAISINIQALGYLTDLQDRIIMADLEEPGIFFPLLKVINVGALSNGFTAEHVDIAMKYVLPRIRNGHPIAMLNISKYSPLGIPPNSHVFREAKGLKLRYKRPMATGIFEYTCGSDDPEKHIHR